VAAVGVGVTSTVGVPVGGGALTVGGSVGGGLAVAPNVAVAGAVAVDEGSAAIGDGVAVGFEAACAQAIRSSVVNAPRTSQRVMCADTSRDGAWIAAAAVTHNTDAVKDRLDSPDGLWLPPGMSRRSFLKLTGLAAAGAAVLPYGFLQAASAASAPDSLGLGATYDVSANLQWANHRLVVVSTAHVTNTTPSSVTALTFNLVPAKIGQISMNGVTVDGSSASASLDDMNVIVHLNSALAPNASADVTIRYSAHFNSTNPNRKWLFAERHGIVTAYRWIPWLSNRYPFKTPLFGDAFATQIASRVDVSLTSDRAGMIYATPGTRVSVSGNTQTFVAYNVRDFNFTASPDYHVTSENHGGVQFDYYTIELSQHNLAVHAKQAFDKYTALVGAFPYSRMFVAETSPGFAMESPQGFWIPDSYTTADATFGVIHEVGHMWFYAAVGSNQATEPFADEALVEYLTRTIEGYRGSKVPTTNLDGSVYDYTSDTYYEVIYIQGSNYLNAYRKRVGDSNFYAGLRAYYQQYKWKMGGTKQLLTTLDAHSGGNGGGHHARFPGLFPPGS
jgi:hypothetical protein